MSGGCTRSRACLLRAHRRAPIAPVIWSTFCSGTSSREARRETDPSAPENAVMSGASPERHPRYACPHRQLRQPESRPPHPARLITRTKPSRSASEAAGNKATLEVFEASVSAATSGDVGLVTRTRRVTTGAEVDCMASWTHRSALTHLGNDRSDRRTAVSSMLGTRAGVPSMYLRHSRWLRIATPAGNPFRRTGDVQDVQRSAGPRPK